MSTYLADTAENLTVAAASATFTYRRMGPRGGVPLVLLNRFRATIDWWDPEFLDHPAADHDVIVFDDIGVGYTTGEPRDSVEGFADGAAEFIDALGLTQVARIEKPVLHATGVRDVMIPALASFVAVQNLPSATLVAYGDAGHAFLFQHAKDFATHVANFLDEHTP
jgi:pimeloyl-ACP methyl ester carboxylesterase